MKRNGGERKQRTLLYMLCHLIKLAVENSPGMSLLFFLSLMGTGVCTAGNVFFKQNFFDRVEELVRGSTTIGLAVGSGIAMALFLILTLIVQAISELIQNNFSLLVRGQMGKLLNEKAARIYPVVFEDNRFLDHVNKAYTGMEAGVEVMCSTLSVCIGEIAYFVFMGSYFFSIKPALLLMFGLSFAPSIVSSVLRRRMYAQLETRSAPYRRKYEYFERCICAREYVKETRLWRAEGFFGKLYRGNLGQYTQLQWRTEKHSELTEVALRFFLLTGYVGTVAMLFYYVFQGEVTVGAFAAVFASLDQLFDRMENVFNYRVGGIMRCFGAAQNFYAFLDLEERGGTDRTPLQRELIELKDLSFTYPNSTESALKEINLTVNKGETVAIVGVNGSGKSTLTRLLLGLFLPTKGQLLIDGKDVKEIAPEALYRGNSVVFQRYQCYKMTVEENTRLSDIDSDKQVKDVLKKADFPLDNGKFTEGLDTMLGKDFGGIDLSGGQWQRLAIARGLYREHDMIVLDEPTAAIDPLEEAEIYRKFAEISKDKTAFIVTHRLGSAKIADRIIVMERGRIVEAGNHEELMEMGGRYRELYEAQAKWYA